MHLLLFYDNSVLLLLFYNSFRHKPNFHNLSSTGLKYSDMRRLLILSNSSFSFWYQHICLAFERHLGCVLVPQNGTVDYKQKHIKVLHKSTSWLWLMYANWMRSPLAQRENRRDTFTDPSRRHSGSEEAFWLHNKFNLISWISHVQIKMSLLCS